VSEGDRLKLNHFCSDSGAPPKRGSALSQNSAKRLDSMTSMLFPGFADDMRGGGRGLLDQLHSLGRSQDADGRGEAISRHAIGAMMVTRL